MVRRVLKRYARPFRVPGSIPAWLIALIGRLTIGGNALALLLLVRHVSGELAIGSAAAACFLAANAVGALVQGQLIDSYGPSRVLLPFGTIHTLALLVTAAFAATTPVVMVSAAVAGFCLPQLSASVRAMWARELSDRDDVTTAFSMETVVIEAVKIVGPLLVALAFVADARLPVVGSAVLAVIGSIGFALSRPARRLHGTGRSSRVLAAIANRRMIACLALSAMVGSLVGGYEVALAAYSALRLSPAAVGVFIALFAFGSVCGGLGYGARDFPGTQRIQLGALLAASAVAAALVFAMPYPPVVGVVSFLAGVTAAPMYTLLSLVMTAIAGVDSTAGVYTAFVTAFLMGNGLGTVAAGLVGNGLGGRAGFALVCGVAVGTAAFALWSLPRNDIEIGRHQPEKASAVSR